MPVGSFSDGTANKRSQGDTSYRGETEKGHGHTSCLGSGPDIRNGTTDDINGHRGESSTKESGNDHGVKVWSHAGRNQKDDEENIRNLWVDSKRD